MSVLVHILVLVHVLDPGHTPILILIPGLNLMDMKTTQDLALLEVEAMVEVIGRIAILTVGMIKAKDAGIVMINVSGSIILWPHLQLLLSKVFHRRQQKKIYIKSLRNGDPSVMFVL